MFGDDSFNNPFEPNNVLLVLLAERESYV